MRKSSLKKIFVLALLISGCGGASALTHKVPLGIRAQVSPNLYIFTVGIDDYSRVVFAKWKPSNLRLAKKDAITLAEEFTKRGAGLFGQIKRVTLVDHEAKHDKILATLDSLAQEISSDDVLIFAYSGLGVTHLSEGEFSLIPSDFNENYKGQTLISVGLLQSYFRKIRAKSKLIILDSCDSAAGYEKAAQAFIEQDPNVKRISYNDFLLLGTDTMSLEKEEAGHGSVTSVVLNGLRGKADLDENGIVSSDELESYAYCGGIEYSAKYTDHRNRFRMRTLSTGHAFPIGNSDKGLMEWEAKVRKEKESQKSGNDVSSGNKNPGGEKAQNRTTSEPGDEEESKDPARNGEDYALLFANENYDNPRWAKLKNPMNDVKAIAEELRGRYGFKEIIIKKDLTTKEIYDVIEEYQKKRALKPDDQLFIFFAGHGVTDTYNKGFYAGTDSPSPLRRENENLFVSLDGVLNAIDRIGINHIMVVFDACYAGQVWKPSIQLVQDVALAPIEDKMLFEEFTRKPTRLIGASFIDNDHPESLPSDIPTGVYAKRKMKNRTRVILTSGDKPVLDSWRKPNGTLSDHSPFADAFLNALRTSGGEDGVLITPEIVPYIDKLTPEPQKGRLSNSDGDFVFIYSISQKRNR